MLISNILYINAVVKPDIQEHVVLSLIYGLYWAYDVLWCRIDRPSGLGRTGGLQGHCILVIDPIYHQHHGRLSTHAGHFP